MINLYLDYSKFTNNSNLNKISYKNNDCEGKCDNTHNTCAQNAIDTGSGVIGRAVAGFISWAISDNNCDRSHDTCYKNCE